MSEIEICYDKMQVTSFLAMATALVFEVISFLAGNRSSGSGTPPRRGTDDAA